MSHRNPTGVQLAPRWKFRWFASPKQRGAMFIWKVFMGEQNLAIFQTPIWKELRDRGFRQRKTAATTRHAFYKCISNKRPVNGWSFRYLSAVANKQAPKQWSHKFIILLYAGGEWGGLLPCCRSVVLMGYRNGVRLTGQFVFFSWFSFGDLECGTCFPNGSRALG